MAGEQQNVQIFTDGSCSGNPGPGGWAAVLRYRGKEREIYGKEDETTNNRMELRAVIEALNTLTRPCSVTIYTDSQYVMNGVTEWMQRWKRNGWKSSDKKPVKNQDLWLLLEEALLRHTVTWEWVRGHSGHPENERADRLAKLAITHPAE